jgi:hypothetical protein
LPCMPAVDKGIEDWHFQNLWVRFEFYHQNILFFKEISLKDFAAIKIWSGWNFDVTDPRVYSTHYNGGLQPKLLQTELADKGNRLYRIQLGACLVCQKFYKIVQILRHIESLDIYMKH